MAHLPNTIEDSSAVLFRNILIGVAVVIGLIAWGAFSNGNAGGGLLMALISGTAAYVASQVTTERQLRGGTAVYR